MKEEDLREDDRPFEREKEANLWRLIVTMMQTVLQKTIFALGRLRYFGFDWWRWLELNISNQTRLLNHHHHHNQLGEFHQSREEEENGGVSHDAHSIFRVVPTTHSNTSTTTATDNKSPQLYSESSIPQRTTSENYHATPYKQNLYLFLRAKITR